MKKKNYTISFAICFSIAFSALFSQKGKTISVKSPYTKKTIYTLKPGETLYQQEASLSFSHNATSCEFITLLNEKFYLHIDNKPALGPFSEIPYRWKNDPFYQIRNTTAQGKHEEFLYFIKTGEKMGPYQFINFPNDYYYNNIIPFKGFIYIKNNQSFVKIFGTAKDLGPYDEIRTQVSPSSKSKVCFTYVKDSMTYIYRDGKISGPYKDYHREDPYFSYKAANGYYVSMDEKVFGPYKERPGCVEDHAKRTYNYLIKEENGIYDGYLLLEDGSKVPVADEAYNLFFFYNLPDNSWMKIEQTAMIKARKDGNLPECSDYASWNIYYSNGKSYGPFTIKGWPDIIFNGKDVFIGIQDPPKYDCDVVSGKLKLNKEPYKACVFSKGEKSGPLDVQSDIINLGDFNFKAGKTKIAFVNNRKLYIDKTYSGLDNVHEFKFEWGSDNWYAVTVSKARDTAIIYRNGKKISIITVPEFYLQYFEFTGNDYELHYTSNNLNYLKLSSVSKEFGPFEKPLPWQCKYIISKDKKHFAFIKNYTKIIVDGKDIGTEGFSLSSNDKEGTFHWVSIDGQNIILHNYDPDQN
ncbi:MAG: hypothetical protein IAF38_16600 [Bacteroidia bacterium]|nr:hypothetical protein [Bacteroidia bacterium]